ncbi:MAG TPA: sigma-70 family RNA polymerase sigma factor [Candidatus Avirikenella pullistercoris]|nr:sigma-70 family RNA polymerase sigma factor [Candidatus Avirikenella pullistercoris]
MDVKQKSDQALIDAYRKGDESAINVLIEKHRKKIYNYILMLVKNTDTADDIFQELFIKVINSLRSGKYSDSGKFVSWTLRIAHNLVIDHFRGLKQKNFVSADTDFNVLNNKDLVDGTIEDRMITEQTENDVRKLVDFLPLEQREVVIMRHYLGLSFKEIAEQTDVSINTALGRMRYALMNMRKMIKENQITIAINN